MTRWVCPGCGTTYAMALFRCPRCHNTDFREERTMPKITVHAGPSIAGVGGVVSEGSPAPVTTPDPVEPVEVEAAEAIEVDEVEPTPEPEPEPEPEVAEEPVTVQPSPTALKADWVAYAVTCGAAEADAAALTKAELIATYGS